MIVERFFETSEISKEFQKRSIFMNVNRKAQARNSQPQKSGVKTKLINNVLCFVHYKIGETKCEFMVHTKLRPNPIAIVVPIDKRRKFDLDREISKL